MIAHVAVITKLPDQLNPSCIAGLIQKNEKLFFLDDGTLFLLQLSLVKNPEATPYVFCSYGLTKRNLTFNPEVINAGLAYLSQIIENSSHFMVL
jgi:hypothetical protein